MAARAEPASPAAPLAAASPGLPPRGGVRLRALVLIRWVAVAGQLFTAATVHWGLGFTLPLLPVGGAIALSALLNLAVSLGRPASARIDDREATIFLAFDIVQLAVLLYLTGGLAYGSGRVEFAGMSETQTHLGWTLGGGVEVGLTPNWSAKAEYFYVRLDDRSYVLTGVNNGFSSNVFRLGVNYRF